MTYTSRPEASAPSERVLPGTGAAGASEPAWLAESDPATRRYLCWVYLREVIEASNEQILDALWEGGWWHSIVERYAPGSSREPGQLTRVEEVATAIATRGRAARVSPELLESTAHRYDRDPRRVAEVAQDRGWRLITPEGAEWDRELDYAFARMDHGGAGTANGIRGQAHAPFALWAQGQSRLDAAIRSSATVVGTRAASRYGRQACDYFVGELVSAGVSIVSGGAVGIDTFAHRSALESGVPTVATLACGLDVDYPRTNARLFQEILGAGGLIVSEYAPGTNPARYRFLTRNRLAAALGRATIVIEAALRSGALNTMNWAEAMIKPTFAVPGPITSVGSQGCLERIQSGRATMAWQPEQILEVVAPAATQLQLQLDAAPGTAGAQSGAAGPHRDAAAGTSEAAGGQILSWEQTAAFDAVGRAPEEGSTLTAILEETGLLANQAIRALRELSTAGLVYRSGDHWVRT